MSAAPLPRAAPPRTVAAPDTDPRFGAGRTPARNAGAAADRAAAAAAAGWADTLPAWYRSEAFAEDLTGLDALARPLAA
jgi:hypothetical protein